MKKLVCDLCGESDFIKVGGMFECQVCGAKYSTEEARSLFRDVNDSGHKEMNEETEAPNDYQDEGTPVFTPKAGPSIVKKVVVAKPVTVKSNDSQAAKRIVSQVKPVGQAQPEAPKGTVIKKVVVKPVQQVRVAAPQKKVAPKPVDVKAMTGAGVGTMQMIENLFILSENAYDSENFTDAENYANRVIEIDATNSDAWLMKGNCVAKLSTPQNFRFLEAINC